MLHNDCQPARCAKTNGELEIKPTGYQLRSTVANKKIKTECNCALGVQLHEQSRFNFPEASASKRQPSCAKQVSLCHTIADDKNPLVADVNSQDTLNSRR